MCGTQTDQNMNVICSPTDFDRHTAKILDDAANVSVKTVAPVFSD